MHLIEQARVAVTEAIRIQNELSTRVGRGVDAEEFNQLYHGAVALYAAQMHVDSAEKISGYK
jgi:hypothetical protein